MAEELRGAGGVERVTAGEGVPEGTAQAGVAEAAAEGAPATAKVRLEEMEEFRAYQSAFDRRYEQLRADLRAQTERAQEAQRRLEESQLANADPEQVVAYYQEQAARARKVQEEAQAAAMLRSAVDDAAGRLLGEHGLDVNTPGLDWSGGPTWEGYGKLAESVAKFEALKAMEAMKVKGAEVSQAAQAAKAEALGAAGVTKVSTATGAAPGKENLIADITDPSVLLRMAMRQRRKGGRQ